MVHNKVPREVLIFDSTLRIVAERYALLSIIQAAGWPIWPLILCSIAALTLIIERLVSLRSATIVPPRLLDEVLQVIRSQLPDVDVVNKLAQNSLLGAVLATGLRTVMADPRITEASLRNALEIAGRSATHRLDRFLNTIGTIATAAPLLGLLGTVIGMIEIFGAQSPANSNPQALAAGISIALYNTAFGLIVAIPALMFYRYFRGVVDGYVMQLEEATERIIPHLMRFSAASPRSAG